MNQPATPAATAISTAQSTPSFGSISGVSAICCPRCTGTGYLSQFRHIERGRCFRCGGVGSLSMRQAA